MLDLSRLSQPVDPSAPCGPDCEYDADFLALSQALVGKPEQQFGTTVIPAVDPDWRAVERMATELLGRTKDLRIAVWLTQASTHQHGVQGYAAGIELVLLLCQEYWDDVHPRLVIDGDEDPYLRINALSSLSDSGGGYGGGSEVMRALRAALLFDRALPVSVRDVEMAASNDPAARYTSVQVASILKDAVAAGAEPIAAFERSVSTASALAKLVDERMPSGEQPDFSALIALNKVVSGAIGRAKVAEPGDVGDDFASEPDGDGPAAAASSAVRSVPGEIRSRDDARRALQRVCEYLERHEQSNPASLFARRAERMLGMGFFDIMQELSPDSISHLQMLTGAKASDDS